MKQKLTPPPRPNLNRLKHGGEWAIDEIKIRVLSLRQAVISYERYEVNAIEYDKFVNLTWFDRRKGITLQQKVQDVYDRLKLKLEAENVIIRELKHIQEGIKR